MLFTSIEFLFIFLPVVLIIYFFLGFLQLYVWAAGWLGLASLFFYGYDDPQRLLPIIFASITFNFLLGRELTQRGNLLLLELGVAGNLLLLGYFKYTGFLLASITTLTGWPMPDYPIALPIGISFFTFTQIAFLVDVYRRQARAYEASNYFLFVTFFPHLIAGPILHHKEMMPQFEDKRIYSFSGAHFFLGLTWFTMGFAKKVMLADGVARFVAPGFDVAAAGGQVSFADAWISALAYSLQLYFDFSGYSDMAMGLALMFGIRLPLNFNSPYRATSLTDFWHRWHMTLSRFLRDYLYIPLGGNRRGIVRRYLNLMLTMVLGGLWHGAAATFVVWGAIHGVGLAVNHLWNTVTQEEFQLPRPVGWLLTMLVVVAAWIPFRADSLHAAMLLWYAMVPHSGAVFASTQGSQTYKAVGWITVLFAVALFAQNTNSMFSYTTKEGYIRQQSSPWRPTLRWAVISGLVFGAAVMMSVTQPSQEFLYYRF